MNRELPSLNALHAFEAAARLQSISRAADELNVTHGAVSRQVRALEEQLGVPLFNKCGRGLRLTDEGAFLRDASGNAFQGLQDACVEVKRRTEQGPFVLACPGSFLARWFIPRMERLQRAFPDLQLQLATSEAEQDPRRSGVDATLCFAQGPWPEDMQVVALANERIGPVLSPHHPRAEQLAQGPLTALLDEQLLHPGSRPQAWPMWAASQGLSKALPTGQSFEHLYFLLEAALAGMGVAIAPQLLVADDLASGRLIAPWGFVETAEKLTLWMPARGSSARGQRLAEWLRHELMAVPLTVS